MLLVERAPVLFEAPRTSHTEGPVGGGACGRTIDSIDCNAIVDATVASITIRKLDPETKERLRVRAAQRQRSMEEEARHILREALAREELEQTNLAESIKARFKQFGGVDLKVAPREPIREPPEPSR